MPKYEVIIVSEYTVLLEAEDEDKAIDEAILMASSGDYVDSDTYVERISEFEAD